MNSIQKLNDDLKCDVRRKMGVHGVTGLLRAMIEVAGDFSGRTGGIYGGSFDAEWTAIWTALSECLNTIEGILK